MKCHSAALKKTKQKNSLRTGRSLLSLSRKAVLQLYRKVSYNSTQLLHAVETASAEHQRIFIQKTDNLLPVTKWVRSSYTLPYYFLRFHFVVVYHCVMCFGLEITKLFVPLFRAPCSLYYLRETCSAFPSFMVLVMSSLTLQVKPTRGVCF